MENYDPHWDELEIIGELERATSPLSPAQLSNYTKLPYHRIIVALMSLLKQNRLSFSCQSKMGLVPGEVCSGNELSTGGSSFGNELSTGGISFGNELSELSYKIKALKVGGKDYKYYWLCDGNDTPLVYIGGGNTKTPLANRYRCAVEEAMRKGKFEGLAKAELKALISQIKARC